MKFYFDESGDFRVPDDPTEHAVAIVVGVVVPETVEARLKAEYSGFLAGLSLTAFNKHGEPKGSRLTDEELRDFAVLISEIEGLLICPVMLDLTSMAGKGTAVQRSLVAKLEATAPNCVHQTMRDEVTLLARQIANLSPEASFRICAWAHCIKRSVYDSVLVHAPREYDACWSDMTFVVDPVQTKKGSREECVFTKMLPGWVTRWSHDDPMALIQEIHTADHPFKQNWDTGTGIDLGKMFRDKIQFVDSASSVGIQVADIAAYIARRATVGISTCDELINYGWMMSQSIRSPAYAHGLFSFCETDKTDIARRYYGLDDAVARVRLGKRLFNAARAESSHP